MGGLTPAPITSAVFGEGMLFASATFAGSPSEPLDIPPWDTLVERYDANKDAMLAVTEMPREEGIHLRPGSGEGRAWRLRVLAGGDGYDRWQQGRGGHQGRVGRVPRLLAQQRGQRAGDSARWRRRQQQFACGVESQPRHLRDAVAAVLSRPAVLVRNGGMVTSYIPDSGRLVLDRQRLGTLGQYVASPVAADGRIYAASETGTIVVFRAGDTLEVLARNDLGESITATPAIADHKLYVRTAKHLWAFGS